MTRRAIHRRTVLKGLGTALTLPWLEAMMPRKVLAASAVAKPPVRLGFLYIPNGVNVDHWYPTTTGFNFDLPTSLQPLAAFKDDINVISGLTHDKARSNQDGAGDHARAAACFLTGVQPKKSSSHIRTGVSIDQIAAEVLGNETRFPSIEIGCEAGRLAGQCDSEYSCAYSANISWKSPTTPMAKEVDPRQIFDRLFGSDNPNESRESAARRTMFQKSVLDFVKDDANRLQKKLGRTDQRKLDEYFTGVREIERRIELQNKPIDVGAQQLTRPTGIPRDYAEHVGLLSDLMVLAFQTDSTRVCTFMYGSEGSGRSYPFIGIPEGHHELSHHGSDPAKLEKLARIDQYNVTLFSQLLEKMKAAREGESSLLENSVIVFGGGINDGNRHNNENLPIIVAGQGGNTILTGRSLRYEYETPLCNLYLNMLDRVDIHLPRFGDSTGRLREFNV